MLLRSLASTRAIIRYAGAAQRWALRCELRGGSSWPKGPSIQIWLPVTWRAEHGKHMWHIWFMLIWFRIWLWYVYDMFLICSWLFSKWACEGLWTYSLWAVMVNHWRILGTMFQQKFSKPNDIYDVLYWGHKGWYAPVTTWTTSHPMRPSKLLMTGIFAINHRCPTYVSTQQQLRGIRLKGHGYRLLLVQYTRNDESDDSEIVIRWSNYYADNQLSWLACMVQVGTGSDHCLLFIVYISVCRGW